MSLIFVIIFVIVLSFLSTFLAFCIIKKCLNLKKKK